MKSPTVSGRADIRADIRAADGAVDGAGGGTAVTRTDRVDRVEPMA